jgi:hypothetical protein
MTKAALTCLAITCIVELFCIAVLLWPARASESCNRSGALRHEYDRQPFEARE